MKKISFYLLLVPAAIGPLSGCRTPPPTAAAGDTPDRAAARMAHIAELSRSGETAAARVANEEAYRAYPTNEAVAVRLAMVYLSEERLSDARRIFDELLRANPDAGEARLLRAALRKSMGDAAGALADLAEGAARTGQAEFFAETARLLPAAGETDAALDALRRGVERAAPRRALVSAAAALREQLRREGATNRLDRLQAILDELAERARAEPDTLADLGRLYLMEGDGARAIALLSRARELAPGEATLHTQLALALTSQRRTAEAALTLEDGLRRATDPLPLRRLLAALYRQQAPQDPTALSRAREQIESILAQQPDDAEALERAGQLWLQSGRPLDALARFARLAAVLPDRAAARRGLAAYFAAVGQTAETLAALDRLAAAIPDEPRWAWYRAVVCEAAGDTENALRHYETALRGGDPDGNIALRLVGLLAVADPARGRRTLEDALLRHQKNPRLAVAGGLLEWNDGRPAAAADFFALAQAWIREKGQVPHPGLAAREALARQKSGGGETARDVARAARTNENYAVFMDQLARGGLADESDPNSATDAARALLAALDADDPSDPLPALARGRMEFWSGAASNALPFFTRAAERSGAAATNGPPPFDAQFWFEYGAAAERNGEMGRADEYLRRCLALDPRRHDAQNYLAYMWADRGERLDEGLDLVRRALAAQPDSGAYVDTLGWIYYRLGRYEKALTEIRRAAEMVPQDPTVWDHLGDVLDKLGNADEARACWRRSFQLDPEQKESRAAAKLQALGEDMTARRAEFLNEAPRAAPSAPSAADLAAELAPTDEDPEAETDPANDD